MTHDAERREDGGASQLRLMKMDLITFSYEFLCLEYQQLSSNTDFHAEILFKNVSTSLFRPLPLLFPLPSQFCKTIIIRGLFPLRKRTLLCVTDSSKLWYILCSPSGKIDTTVTQYSHAARLLVCFALGSYLIL